MSRSRVFGGTHPQADPGRRFHFSILLRLRASSAAAARFRLRLRPRRACPSGRGAPGRRGPARADVPHVRASAAVRGLQAAPPPSRRRAGQTAAAMFVARSIAADHKDLIHDVSFDFHGRRMATCSSDQSVKVRAAQRGGRRRSRDGPRPRRARPAAADAATPEAARALPAGGLWGHGRPRSRRSPTAPARGGSGPRGARRTRGLGLRRGPRLRFYALGLALGFPWAFPTAPCVSFLWVSLVFLCPGYMGFPEGIIQASYTHTRFLRLSVTLDLAVVLQSHFIMNSFTTPE